jgi:imidazolonepropionase-like amidohydrolase
MVGLTFGVVGPQVVQATDGEVLVLQNATLHTLAGAGTLQGTIVIRDGKIVDMGGDVTIPQEATVLDLQGYQVVPGMIDSRSVLWLTDAAIQEGHNQAALNSADAVDLWNEDWQEVARQGVTTVYVQPSSSGTLGGYGAVLRVAPATSRDTVVIRSPAGVQAALGLTGKTSRDRFSEYEKLRKSIQNIVDGKDQASSPADRGRAATARRGSRPPGGGPTGFNRGRSTGPRTQAVRLPDMTKEVLQQVVDGNLPLRLEAHHSDAIRLAARLADDFGLQVIVDGASHGSSVTWPSLPVIVGPLLETLDSPPEYRRPVGASWLAKVAASGQPWAIASFAGNSRGSQTLRVQAARAVAHGIAAEEVLKAITVYPARLLGIADHTGTLEVGKQADIAVFAGDPLDPSVPAAVVISAGKITWQQETALRNSLLVDIPDLPESFPDQFVLQGNRIWQNGKLQPARLVVRNGRIVTGVRGNSNPDSLPVFDLKDAVLTPGLVVAHTHLGQAESLRDSTLSDQTHVQAVDAWDASAEGSRKMLQAGFLHAAFAPAAGNTSSGQIGQLRMGRPGQVVARDIASQFNLVESARNTEVFPSSLGGQLDLVQRLLQGKAPESSLYVSAAVRRALDSQKNTVAQSLIQRQRKAIIAATTELEIESALRLVGEYDLDATLLVDGRLGDQLEGISKTGTGLIVRPLDGTEYHSRFAEIALAGQRGSPIAFAGESPDRIRMTAAMLVAAGLSEQTALLGLTSVGAEVAGMRPGTAELQEGGNADFVIWTGSPVNPAARPVAVVVNGKRVPHNDKP